MSVVLGGVGAAMVTDTFPFVAGDPEAGQPKIVPAWTSLVGGLGLGLLALAVVCLLARTVVRLQRQQLNPRA